MLNSMYFYSRHKIELFKDEVWLALAQPPTSMVKDNKAKGSTDGVSISADLNAFILMAVP